MKFLEKTPMIAAAEANFTNRSSGWEDSTMGNIFASYCIKGELKATTMKSGIEYMTYLADWYTKTQEEKELDSSRLVEVLQVISQFV